ncbi:hypothetical protein KSP35_10790 [Aquihabitans sp. G128]|uniref:hypothetical protein n=1 Tax=Aquihabitans sp. G128 TaxID=2849779 RepID=UPI001C24E565|nr:hypothetical protein [Aquihabitans sp. G128]QXC63223.1 hypothetical protein KSP35_10790 [Aquihabitans sp. G128]
MADYVVAANDDRAESLRHAIGGGSQLTPCGIIPARVFPRQPWPPEGDAPRCEWCDQQVSALRRRAEAGPPGAVGERHSGGGFSRGPRSER